MPPHVGGIILFIVFKVSGVHPVVEETPNPLGALQLIGFITQTVRTAVSVTEQEFRWKRVIVYVPA
jgi:hypothetical protein